MGETDAIVRVRFDAAARSVSGEPERVVSDLPGGGNHWTRTLRFGPDDGLYVNVGSSCNVCIEEDERRATLLRFEPDGSGGEIYASGLRNTVGFDWRPGTGELFGTDNGRDLLGDDFPPCELNRDRVEGGFYGWPYANGDRVIGPGPGRPATQRRGSARALPPVAPLPRPQRHRSGITFLRGRALSAEPYRGAAHGRAARVLEPHRRRIRLPAWCPSTGAGAARISRARLRHGLPARRERVIGRPVDVVEGPDGAIYFSDDYTGAIYRVARADGAGSATAPPAETPEKKDPLAGIPPAVVEQRVQRGRALYERYFCAQCHEGVRAAEGVIVVPLQELGSRYGVDDLVAFLEAPTPPMPALDLSEEERRDLAVYLLSAHP